MIDEINLRVVREVEEEEGIVTAATLLSLSSSQMLINNNSFTKAVEEASAGTLATATDTASLESAKGTLPGVVCTSSNHSTIQFVEDNDTKTTDENTNTKKSCQSQVFIPVLEAEGGSDKDKEGHRKDTVPIVKALEETGVRSVIFQFREEFAEAKSHLGQTEEEVSRRNNEARAHNDALRSSLLQTTYSHEEEKSTPVVNGIVVRNNPGTLSYATQAKFDAMLVELYELGVNVMNHPIVQQSMGAKDSLVKIRNLKAGMEDTSVYYDRDAFREGFMKSIAFQPRVIKQNRGSQGEGIWICKLKNEDYCKTFGEKYVTLDTELVLVEAFDNHVEEHTVGEFIEFCINGRTNQSGSWLSSGEGRYFDGGVEKGAMIIDQRFLPRIIEGEVRCTMVGSSLVQLVHKVPKEGAFSATLKSGAVYTSYAPDHPKFANLVANFQDDIPHIMSALGFSAGYNLPLLWTADYIFGEKDEAGNDIFHVGEFNCTCVGITQQLHLTKNIAQQAVENCKVNDNV